ncbi:MAG TPA: AMP-binding protein [Trebonia sp.]|nr:AMP-binding protein [Trebonia sp.]
MEGVIVEGAPANPVSIARRIGQLVDEHPDEDDVVYRHIALDGTEPGFGWPSLDRRSGQVAAALATRGLGQGDRLAVALRNSPQFIVSVLAAWKLGAVPVPIRWDIPDWELGRLRAVVDARVFLTEADIPWLQATADDPVPALPDVISPQFNGTCSSGSTGTPKVILTERPGLYTPELGATFAEMWGAVVTHPQTVLVPTAMYHTNGFTTLYNLIAGARLIVMEKFDAARVVDVIERYRVTNFTATPTMLQRIADLPRIDDRDLSSLEFFIQGAAMMPPQLTHRWAKLVGPERIIMAYGMTEGLGLTALRGDEWMSHQGSVGRGIRGTEVRILADDGTELPAGQIGEIFLRTPHVAGYRYLGTVPRMKTTEDGFATAGDMGYLDEQGYLFLADRRVDMIVTGGANVFPAEVEAALIDHPAIADVVVIGLRDPQWGRRVHAIIEPADPAAPPAPSDVIAYAKSRLAPYKVPKTVELVDIIPRSAATKVNRGSLVAARGG